MVLTSSNIGHYYSTQSVKYYPEKHNSNEICSQRKVNRLDSCVSTLMVFVVSCMRQAIEGFALMVKKTAQTLQLFGTELAETELPNEIQATTLLLSTHTDKKDKMKVIYMHYIHDSFVYCIPSMYIYYVFG